MIDFTGCPFGYKEYGGSDSKVSIIYNDELYMIKKPEKKTRKNELQTSTVNNVLSEYIGSRIMASLGIETHYTLLGLYEDEPVVACKDFCKDNEDLLSFKWFMLGIYRKDEIGRIPSYSQIYETVEKHPQLNKIKEIALRRYWETFIGDALIGNFDRHKENWSYLVNKDTGEIHPSPVYDCGSSLYPNLSETGMSEVMYDRSQVLERIYKFPKAALNKNSDIRKVDKYGYYELMLSGADEYCNEAMRKIIPRIDMERISKIIDETPFLSNIRKDFYKTMVYERKTLILDKALELQGKDRSKDIEVINRIRDEYNVLYSSPNGGVLLVEPLKRFSDVDVFFETDTSLGKIRTYVNGEEMSTKKIQHEHDRIYRMQNDIRTIINNPKAEISRDNGISLFRN